MTETSPSSCAFCQRTGARMAREHVLPRWLSLLGAEGGDYTREFEGRSVRTPFIEVVTKRVCQNCNTGWLSRIEGTTARVMTPLYEGTSQRISEYDRWVVARWFSKTILTFALAASPRGKDVLPSDSYAKFYSSAQPFMNQFTFMGGYQGQLLPIQFGMHIPPAEAGLGVSVFFHFHRVVICAMFLDTEKPTSIAFPHNLGEYAHIIWPPQRGLLWYGDPTESLPWPASHLAGEAAIDGLLKALGMVERP